MLQSSCVATGTWCVPRWCCQVIVSPAGCAGVWPEQAPHLVRHAVFQLREHAQPAGEGALQLPEHVLCALLDVFHAAFKDLHSPEALTLHRAAFALSPCIPAPLKGSMQLLGHASRSLTFPINAALGAFCPYEAHFPPLDGTSLALVSKSQMEGLSLMFHAREKSLPGSMTEKGSPQAGGSSDRVYNCSCRESHGKCFSLMASTISCMKMLYAIMR